MYQLLKPLLFRLEAERAHELVTGMFAAASRAPLAPALLRALYSYQHPMLASVVAGLRFANPVGLAAGFDKQASQIAPMSLLGFSHIEVGTVTPLPQPGNPQPRLFRLPRDGALINRMGFNSPGMDAVAERLELYRRTRRAARHMPIVGVNIGKNRDTPLEQAAEDYRAVFYRLAPLADYVTINISSPNTPGLRQLHDRAALEDLLGGIAAARQRMLRHTPLLLKISPDETDEQIEQVVDVAQAAGVSGIIASNTTLSRAGATDRLAGETGGLSGRPLAARSLAVVRQVARLTEGALPVIGVGGVSDAHDAYALIRAGARLVQVYSSLIYGGPRVVQQINNGLVTLLKRDGFASIAEAVGAGGSGGSATDSHR